VPGVERVCRTSWTTVIGDYSATKPRECFLCRSVSTRPIRSSCAIAVPALNTQASSSEMGILKDIFGSGSAGTMFTPHVPVALAGDVAALRASLTGPLYLHGEPVRAWMKSLF
jgi:hypothetical protein